MKKVLLMANAILLSSCIGMNSNQKKDTIDHDSIAHQRLYDSIARDYKRKLPLSIIDTNGLYTAPVKVIKANLIRREYSNYRDIQLTYKNISSKTISAIKFSWFGKDAFGEPADMGSVVMNGLGFGFTDDPLKAGRTETSSWSILSRNGKKVVLAWPIEVAFKDGTNWTLK